MVQSWIFLMSDAWCENKTKGHFGYGSCWRKSGMKASVRRETAHLMCVLRVWKGPWQYEIKREYSKLSCLWRAVHPFAVGLRERERKKCKIHLSWSNMQFKCQTQFHSFLANRCKLKEDAGYLFIYLFSLILFANYVLSRARIQNENKLGQRDISHFKIHLGWNIWVFIYLKMLFIKLQSNIFNSITPAFSATWSFRNHSNTLICCINYIYIYI